jgi:sensor histidine kinase YesM
MKTDFTIKKNTLIHFLTHPRFMMWRRLLFVSAFMPIALSMPFYSFGGYTEISIAVIYLFGFAIAVAIIALSFFNIMVPMPRYLLKGKYTAYITVLLLQVTGFILLKHLAEEMLLSHTGISRTTNGVTLLEWLSNLMMYTIVIVSTSISALLRLWMNDNMRIKNLENEHLKNRMEEFKSRINPQHLYNTLDDIAANVKTNPEQASEILFELSEYLRQQLYGSTYSTQNSRPC